jgi:hypothetical protein
MRRALLSLSLVSALALAACGEEEGKAPGGDDAPEQEDTFDVDDDDSTLDPTFDLFDAALLSSAPATLPGTTGGTVMFTVRATARTEEGEDATLADATDGAAITVNLEDGTELPATLEVLDDQTLAVTVEEGFGADLGAENGRQPLTVWIGDAFLAEVPLTRHLDPDTAAQQLMGEGRDGLVPSVETTLCGWTLADMDADGVAEVYTVGWAADEGVVVGEACRPTTGRAGWVQVTPARTAPSAVSPWCSA